MTVLEAPIQRGEQSVSTFPAPSGPKLAAARTDFVSRPYTEEEIHKMVVMASLGMHPRDIAIRLGRSEGSVRVKFSSMGLKPRKLRKVMW
jgi:hypothetical protein